MDKVKKYSWGIVTYVDEQVMKYEQGSFYIGDVDIEDIKVSKYPSDFNLSHEDIDKLNKGEQVSVEKAYIIKFMVNKDD